MSDYINPIRWPILTQEVTDLVLDCLSNFKDPTKLAFTRLDANTQRTLIAALLEDWPELDALSGSFEAEKLIRLLAVFLQGGEVGENLKTTLMKVVADSHQELISDLIQQVAAEKKAQYRAELRWEHGFPPPSEEEIERDIFNRTQRGFLIHL